MPRYTISPYSSRVERTVTDPSGTTLMAAGVVEKEVPDKDGTIEKLKVFESVALEDGTVVNPLQAADLVVCQSCVTERHGGPPAAARPVVFAVLKKENALQCFECGSFACRRHARKDLREHWTCEACRHKFNFWRIAEWLLFRRVEE